MEITQKGNATILQSNENTIAVFVKAIDAEYDKIKDHNVIVDITANVTYGLKDILLFLELSNRHRKAKKSFVLVVKDFDFNEAPDEIVVVPTLQEAHDIIEMEEIERDLGF